MIWSFRVGEQEDRGHHTRRRSVCELDHHQDQEEEPAL